ncbi:BadF/BadG/BcrA/BcrD ATPase family protein [Pseudoponticoccus marisrubri]|uniref:ATPase n=1 Tax=Pseudoponticoccus marisrubri TaxID=1685382 RepID=A0A0W7WLC6_9RHOB|nr:BadF/BadG/BcrA/BcrD ATPase family protein [Pseudoponticoccus marisrubri]KUF11354.1 ATPase [Pseudoponticoccus marisrubri]
MSDSGNPPVLAVDGGGTRCRVAFDDGRQRHVVETGPANVSTDFEAAVAQVMAGLAELSKRLGQPVGDLVRHPAYLGLAGITGPEIADRLRAALPFARLRIEDDRPAAVRGALSVADGVIAHCGTGSFYAGQHGGAIQLAGGWGSVLGDEASAQWIARKALGLTLEAVDGRRALSALAQAFLDEMGGAAGIVRFAGQARPDAFGALAPQVTRAAEAGDALAVCVMQQGADEIARALPHVGWRPGLRLCLTGGIGPHFAPFLPETMSAGLAAPEAEPMAGALSLARQLAGEFADERG